MSQAPRLPLAAKVAYTAWMAVWIPVYWVANGPQNFLWLCDFANFVVLLAIWRESARLASSQLLGVAVIQALWAADFFYRLIGGRHLIGGTEYMFDATQPLSLRALSLFHLWTVPLLWWMCRRVGYDRRGLRLQVGFTAVLFPTSVWVGDAERNLNWLYAPFGRTDLGLPPWVAAALGVLVVSVVVYWPTDWLMRRRPRELPSPHAGL
mgnify:CR=1 FL=1